MRLREMFEALDVRTNNIEDIAKMQQVDLKFLKAQLKIGIAVEHEHTSDKKLAKEIALDHLGEDPDYYIKLKKIGLEEHKQTVGTK